MMKHLVGALSVLTALLPAALAQQGMYAQCMYLESFFVLYCAMLVVKDI